MFHRQNSETDVPMDLIAFASSDKLKSQVQKATTGEKKNMLRQIRKFKETCLEVGGRQKCLFFFLLWAF